MEKKCNNFGMEDKNINVPFVVYQATAARQERQIKRMWIVILFLIFALIGTNIAWIAYENSFEDYIITEEYDVEQNADGGGYNNSLINVGEISNGEAEN